MKNQSTVQKAMSPEVKTALDNITSLVAQIQSTEGAEAAGAGATAGQGPTADDIVKAYMAQKANAAAATEPDADDPEGETKKPLNTTDGDADLNELAKALADKPGAMKALKAIIASASEGHDANDTAETRMGDLNADIQLPLPGGTNGEDLTNVLKSLLGMNTVAKSASARTVQVDPTMVAITQIAKAMEGLAQQVKNQQFITNELLEGLGVTKALNTDTGNGGGNGMSVRKASSGRPVQNVAGMGNFTIDDLVGAVLKAQGGQQVQTRNGNYDRNAASREDLGKVAKAMGQQAGSLWGDIHLPAVNE